MLKILKSLKLCCLNQSLNATKAFLFQLFQFSSDPWKFEKEAFWCEDSYSQNWHYFFMDFLLFSFFLLIFFLFFFLNFCFRQLAKSLHQLLFGQKFFFLVFQRYCRFHSIGCKAKIYISNSHGFFSSSFTDQPKSMRY